MSEYLNSTTQTIAWFNDRRKEGNLIVRPLFQRNLVWNDKQRSYLIDSILNGYPIPELYLQEKTNSEGNTTYIVVDGQQRITSFLKFIDNEFSIDKDQTDYRWENLYFGDLSDEDKKSLYSYKFVVRVLPDMDDDKLKNIFKRINKNNISLNNQELRQATYSGSFITTINTISDKNYWSELGIFSAQKVRRMEDAEYISEIAVAVLNGHQNKKDNLDNYYIAYEHEFDQAEELIYRFDNICMEILKILPEIKKYRWRNLTDFYTLFLVLNANINKIPFSSDERAILSTKLIRFSNLILDISKKGIEDYKDITNDKEELELLQKYQKGIRSSTDLGSRRNRFDALIQYLEI